MSCIDIWTMWKYTEHAWMIQTIQICIPTPTTLKHIPILASVHKNKFVFKFHLYLFTTCTCLECHLHTGWLIVWSTKPLHFALLNIVGCSLHIFVFIMPLLFLHIFVYLRLILCDVTHCMWLSKSLGVTVFVVHHCTTYWGHVAGWLPVL